jgi:hypothetical protein
MTVTDRGHGRSRSTWDLVRAEPGAPDQIPVTTGYDAEPPFYLSAQAQRGICFFHNEHSRFITALG